MLAQVDRACLCLQACAAVRAHAVEYAQKMSEYDQPTPMAAMADPVAGMAEKLIAAAQGDPELQALLGNEEDTMALLAQMMVAADGMGMPAARGMPAAIFGGGDDDWSKGEDGEDDGLDLRGETAQPEPGPWPRRWARPGARPEPGEEG